MILEFLTDFFVGIISYLGYWGVFFLMMLESMIAPVPSEAVMPFAGFLVAQGRMDFWLAVLASSLGSIVGSLLSYYLGRFGGRPLVLKFGKYLLLRHKDLELTDRWFAKHGEITIFVTRFIPVVRHLISIPAGIARMKLWKFVLYTIIGATLWNTFLLYLGIVLEEKWSVVQKYSSVLDVVVVVAIIAFVVWFVRTHIKRH